MCSPTQKRVTNLIVFKKYFGLEIFTAFFLVYVNKIAFLIEDDAFYELTGTKRTPFTVTNRELSPMLLFFVSTGVLVKIKK